MLKSSLSSTARFLNRNPTCCGSSIRSYRVQLNPLKPPTRFVAATYTREAVLKRKFPILFYVDRFLIKHKWSEAWSYFHSKLSARSGRHLKRGSDRFKLYERAVYLFASYDRFDEALDIYERMRHDGFYPSISTRTMMTMYSLVRNSTDIDSILATLDNAFRDPSFDEKGLLPLVRFLGDTMVFSPSLIDQVLQSWFTHKGPVSSQKLLSYLVHLHVRAGLLEDAQNWLQIHANQEAESSKSPDPEPYASFLSSLATTRRGKAALEEAVARMEKDQVIPDLSIFNALIASQVAHRQYSDAFQTYNLLYKYRGKDLTPDALTFAAIFKAFGSARRLRRADKVLPHLRDLYSNLLECHLIRTKGHVSTPSSALNQVVLNAALRTFMTFYDYPAAFVVLQSFSQTRIEANAETGRIVVKQLIRRARNESRLYSGRVGRTWSGRLLGRQWCENNDAKDIASGISDEQIVDQILKYAEEARKKNQDSDTKDTKPESQNELRTALSKSDRCDTTLSDVGLLGLKRIVRLAFMVDTASPDHAEQQGYDIIKPAKAFSMAIANAKNLMIPDGRLLKVPSLRAKRANEPTEAQ